MSNESTRPTSAATLVALAFLGLFGGACAGFLIEVLIGFVTRGVSWLLPLHIILGFLPLLGAILGAVIVPIRAARRQRV